MVKKPLEHKFRNMNEVDSPLMFLSSLQSSVIERASIYIGTFSWILQVSSAFSPETWHSPNAAVRLRNTSKLPRPALAMLKASSNIPAKSTESMLKSVESLLLEPAASTSRLWSSGAYFTLYSPNLWALMTTKSFSSTNFVSFIGSQPSRTAHFNWGDDCTHSQKI